MKRVFLTLASVVLLLVTFVAGYLFSRSLKPDLADQRPSHTLDGSVVVPAFVLPPSTYMSDAAKNLLSLRATVPMGPPEMNPDITESREFLTMMLSGRVSTMLERYPVTMREEEIAGIPIRRFIPNEGTTAQDRVLINLHGGAFSLCWESCSVLESVPVAALSGTEVISVNYRMAPEFQHPAAVDDVEQVYRELLNTYRPQQIGLYGCSAGGALTAQAASRFAASELPQPGGIGIFGAGGVPFTTGDSGYVAAFVDGSFPPPADPDGDGPDIDMTRGYFSGADMTDPVISPGLHLDVLEKFPPTLVITGTRAMDLSPAVYTHAQLLKAGADSQLLVAEGMSHCYFYQPDFPESQDAYDLIVRFFGEKLD